MTAPHSIKGPVPAPSFDGAERLRIGIVHARWNKEVIDALVLGTLETLGKAGVRTENIVIESVPGSWELPFGVQMMLKQHNLDAVVAIGTLIKGSTMHFEYICEASFHGLQRVALDTQKPVILGILTVLNEEQALQRAGIAHHLPNPGHNHGHDWGYAAVEMALKAYK